MVIINQDHDQVFSRGTKPILKVPVYNNGHFYGCRLMLGRDLLGFFDDLGSAEKEEANINNCEIEVYTVSGYSDYDGGDDFEELIQQFNQFNLHE